MLFAPALFVVAMLLKRRDRRLEAAIAILVIVVVAGLRLALAPHDWDVNVRRVTLFRIDSIVWGFLLYLALERIAPIALDDAERRKGLGLLVALLALSIPAELGVAIAAVGGDPSAQQAFPFVSAAFGMVCVGVLRQAEDAFRGRFVRGVSFYLGRISYSVYLFHIMIVMALKPRIASAPLVLQLAIYVALMLTLSTIFFAGFERPILTARPYYTAGRRAAAAAPRGEARRLRPSLLSIALALAALAAGVLARNAFMTNRPFAFYGLLVLTAGLALALSERARPASRGARRGGARLPHVRARAAVGRRSLPSFDRIATRGDHCPADLFLSRRAGQSGRLCGLVVLLSQRVDQGRRHKVQDQCAGPAKEAAVRPCSRLLRPHVRHHDPDQQSWLSRTGA